jgi:hypothetical protein
MRRLAGDTTHEATSDEVKVCVPRPVSSKRRWPRVPLENRLLKKSVIGDGKDLARSSLPVRRTLAQIAIPESTKLSVVGSIPIARSKTQMVTLAEESWIRISCFCWAFLPLPAFYPRLYPRMGVSPTDRFGLTTTSAVSDKDQASVPARGQPET